MIKLSAILVIYNEEKLIKRCLDSLNEIVDEIIIIHDGKCMDNTLNIVKRYKKAKIFISKINSGIAEPHRPNSIKFAKGKWVLPIDADEYLSHDLKNNILEIIKNNGVIDGIKYSRFRAYWPEYDGKKMLPSNSYKVILIKKSKSKILGLPAFKWGSYENSLDLSSLLYHKPLLGQYNWKINLKKYEKWSKIQAIYYLEYLKFPKKIPSFNYTKNDFPKKTEFRIKFPIFSLFLIIPIILYKNIYLYYKLDFIYSLKKIFLMTYYQILVNFNLIKYKYFINYKLPKNNFKYERIK